MARGAGFTPTGVGRAVRGGESRRHGGEGGKGPGEKPLPAITDKRMLLWFLSELKPHLWKIALGLAASVITTLLGLYQPLVLRDIFDDVIRDSKLNLLPHLASLLILLAVGNSFFGAMRTNVMHLLGQKFVYQFRDRCYKKLLSLDIAYFERERTGDLMSRVSNDVGAVEDMVVHGTDNLIANALRLVGTIGVMFYVSWKIAIVAIIPMPLFVLCMLLFARYVRPIFRRIREELGDINVKLQERISGIYVIKSFAREKAEVAYFDETNLEYWRVNAKSTWMWTTFFPSVELITSFGMVATIWYGASLAAGGSTFSSPGTVVAFLAYLMQFYSPIGALMQTYHMFNRALASLARIFELMDQVPQVVEKEEPIELGRVEGRVEIENVSFCYDTGETVLNDVSVTAEPGETIAIVGRSGAGKTTLVNLIPRFYDPFEGIVKVDGIDLREVSKESLRKNIGIVLQETFLFNASVKDNLRYGRPDATDEEIEQAARAAFAHDFVLELEEGYDTLIGERGVRLSGGQKQRLSIARALLADPKILILDEATSAVDTEAEQVIQAALINLMKDRTTFVIAHRLSTIRRANKIVVIEEGQIVEQDNHEALLAQGGLYAEMYTRQYAIEEDWNINPGIGFGNPPGGQGM